MAGTDQRRSVVEGDDWEPITPDRTRLAPVLIGFAIAMILVPAAAFFATYLLLTR